MAIDTVGDLASLRKMVATTTAVMELVEQGKLMLDDPVTRHWPAIAAHGTGAGESFDEDILVWFAGLEVLGVASPSRNFLYLSFCWETLCTTQGDQIEYKM